MLRSCLAVTSALFSANVANAQQTAIASAPGAVIERAGYVRLEVTLATTSNDKIITFQSACPKRSLWGIDLKELLSGSKHVTLGVAITSPLMGPLEFTPVSIDKKVSGFLGTNKSCDVMIDQIRYLSPAYYVRSYENQQFTVAPTFKVTNAVNPALQATIDTAVSFALKLSAIPAESAAPYQDQLKTLLGQVAVSGNESFPKHPIIRPGPVPADSEFEWRTVGLFTPKDHSAPLDVVLIARLIPQPTLVSDPPAGADGKVGWTPTNVLSSPFAANLTPGVLGGTLGIYISAAVPNDLANFRRASTKTEASNACDPIQTKVQSMGLSDRDSALLMWAITHDRPPSGVDTFDLDNLQCLAHAWTFAPSEVLATRDTTPKDEPAPGAPPTVKQMQAATQIEDAFAIFFKTTVWAERRKIGAALFKYPARYVDADGLLFDSSSSLENADQWLALHTAATPVADRVGCYTYVPAANSSGNSVMYAIADMVSGGSAPQALLTTTFANVSGNDDARIDSLEVATVVSADQKAKILATHGGQCPSGYKPAIIFGG